MRVACLIAVLLPLSVSAQSRAAAIACRDVCQQHVTAPDVRARVCGRCFTDTDRGAWALGLTDEPVLRGVLSERDWAVRWGAVRALAKLAAVTEVRQLATIISQSKGADELNACVTAVHVAGVRKVTTGTLLQSGGATGPAAAARCWARRGEITSQLQLQMYDESPVVRREAVLHVSSFLEQPPGRLVLDAMKDRPVETDAISAELLVELARAGGAPAGKRLIDGASGAPWAKPLVDRLLRVYAGSIDRARPGLTAAAKEDRREAIATLSDLGPLGAAELLTALHDADPANRQAAARGLARGEGLTVGQYAKAKISFESEVPRATQVLWLGYLGSAHDPGCQALIEGIIADERYDEAVRAAGLSALADCAALKSLPQLRAAFTSKSATIRAGAATALGSIPRLPDASHELDPGFRDSAPQVLAATAQASAIHRIEKRIADLLQLLNHDDPQVRLAAARALGTWERSAFTGPLSRLLAIEPDAEVRLVCVESLARIGGPQVINPLMTAAEKDTDARVKLVAKESLRKLGFSRP